MKNDWIKVNESQYVHSSGAEVRYDNKANSMYAKFWLSGHRGWMIYLPNEDYAVSHNIGNSRRGFRTPTKYKTVESAQKAILKIMSCKS